MKGASALTPEEAYNLGLQHHQADRLREAVKLAGDLRHLGALLSELRGRAEKSPLMDDPAFAGGIEMAYRNQWRRWCEAL